MTKQGMAHSDPSHTLSRTDVPPICTIQEKARHTNERLISHVYPVIDNDLARDNVENDIPTADLQDL